MNAEGKLHIAGLPYVAGLYEGEGTVRVVGTDTDARYLRPYPTVAIKMTDLEPLELVQSILGFGALSGPFSPKSHQPHHKPFWVLSVNGFERSQAFAAGVWAWLSPRRRKQLHAVLFRATRESR